LVCSVVGSSAQTSGATQPVIDLILGTRPEAVKIAPLAHSLRQAGFAARLIDTGQQPGRVQEALAPFCLAVDTSLGIQRSSGELNELLALTLTAVQSHLGAALPAAVVVQGDTTTALATALAACMLRIPVVHLEAGLRTGDRSQPFPEETNRILLAGLATLHLAPTERAASALRREGHRDQNVVVTGNTIVDALHHLLPTLITKPMPPGVTADPRHQLMVVTVHRRESWGQGVRDVAGATRELLRRRPTLHAVVVTHPNPAVGADVRTVLNGSPRCDLLAPLPYDQMLTLLSRANLALTDSGGIQEEAPTLRIPAVVTRHTTERPEGVEAGWADLVGTDPTRIIAAVTDRLDSGGIPDTVGNPYGDGLAAVRAAQAIASLLGRAARPDRWEPQPAFAHQPLLAATR